MNALSNETVLLMHKLIAEMTGGDPSLRDASLLDSALASAYATFGGEELYPTVEEKAARLGFSLIANHAFVDGNKRIGTLVMLTFLELCGKPLKPTDAELVRVALAVASGEMDYPSLLAWVRSN